MKTKNGLDIIGIIKEGRTFVIGYNNDKFLMNDSGEIKDYLNESEKYAYNNSINDKEIRKIATINAFLSKEMDLILDENHPIRNKL